MTTQTTDAKQRLEELEEEYGKVLKIRNDAVEGLLRLEGAILILRELVDDAKKDEQEQVPEA